MSRSPETMPRVTVVMPVRNEAGAIRRSLGAVLAQDYPPDRLQVIVADGRSTDATCAIVAELAEEYPYLELVDNPAQIAPAGLNRAICQARGEVIVRVDGHTIVAPDYLHQCVAALQRTDAWNVGGRMVAIGSTPFGGAVAAATSSPFGVGGALFHYLEKEAWVDTVYLGAWRRQVFERIGLFDEELVRNQDDELNYRLRSCGGRILLSPDIHSTYTCRSTWRSLWRQYFQYGYWKVRVLQKHPRQMQPRQFVPAAFVLAIILGIATAAISVLPLTALTALYLTANLLASMLSTRRYGWRLLTRLPGIFATLHFAYGSGFLLGLIGFAGRWRDRQGKVPSLFTAEVEG